MTEQNLQAKIIKYLKSINCYITKIIVSNRSGVPDLICCYKGKFVAFEVKLPNKKPTKLQYYNIGMIQEAGGQAFVVTNLDEVKNFIQSL